jgi:hypothetical protein
MPCVEFHLHTTYALARLRFLLSCTRYRVSSFCKFFGRELKLTWNKLQQLNGESCNRFDQLSETFPRHKHLQKLSTLLISSIQNFKFWGISSSSCQVSKNKVTIVIQDHSQVQKWEQWKTTVDCRKYVYCTWHIGTGRCIQNVIKITSAEYYINH